MKNAKSNNENYHARLDGAIFKNGDVCNGESYTEEGNTWYIAIDKVTLSQYETKEVPTEYLFTMTRFEGNWTETEVKEHFNNNK